MLTPAAAPVLPQLADPADTAQTLYLGLLGEPIDPATLRFLTEFVDLDDPEAVDALGDAILGSSAFEDSFAATGTEPLVRSVIFNLFDRNATIQEVALWSDRIEDDGLERDAFVFSLLDEARESDTEAFEAKLFIADYITTQEAEGDYVPEDILRQSLRSNEDLYAELQALDEASDLLALEQVGTSLGDRPLYAATVGTGETELLFITQQHGDEPIGTEAAMLFLDYLISDAAGEIRENTTITVMARINPDGFERWEQEVGGVRGLVDPRLNNAGQDLNRTYDPENPFGRDTAPEAVAVRELVAETDPDFIFDYHGQGNYRSEDGQLDTMSVLWPTNPEVDPAIREASQRAVVAIAESLDEFDYDQLTLYPGSDDPAIARNGFSLAGTPGVLVEQRYGQEMFQLSQGLNLDYSALVSALALEGFITMQGLAEAAADGGLETYDPALAEQIPERSPSIDYADLYSDDLYVPDDLLVA